MRTALLNHPGEFRDRFSHVWLWGEYPRRESPDVGIDLVAEDRDGKEWAIQCKDYSTGAVTTREVNKFLGAAGRFDARLFVSTSRKPIPQVAWRNLSQARNCRVLTYGDLDQWPLDWAKHVEKPESLVFDRAVYEPRPYQGQAVDAIAEEFQRHPRGQLILPCGTGKSVVALWAAERIVGEGGVVLYVVPSISLLGQTMREWSTQRQKGHRYLGVCSDSSAGKSGPEDADLAELSIRVTTDPEAISQALKEVHSDEMTVVFCTYQSLDVVSKAQATAEIDFDLMICDEAHRTTGVHKKGRTTVSSWLLAHDAEQLRADRRLYMTATPRLYSSNVKEKAKDRQVAIYSMNDEATYGPKFFEMNFKEAVDEGYLSDYEVAIVAVSDGLYANLVGAFVAEHKETGVNVRDVVKLLGCWDALADPTTRGTNGRVTGQRNPRYAIRRAIAFSNTIKSSLNLETWWPAIIRRLAEDTNRDIDLGKTLLDLQIDHIDGKTRASVRAQAINELRAEPPEGRCRLITNAKCLTEGVDVPALDAVLFMEPRRSKVEIVQAVGRVMRRAEGKKRGYIVLPVIVPEGRKVTDSDFLRGSEFQPVWDVISALRAHDDRMNVWVNTADIGGNPPISVIEPKEGSAGSEETEGENTTTVIRDAAQLSLPLNEEIASALVERVGDRRYWESWAGDVGEVTARIRNRLTRLLEQPDQPEIRDTFQQFLEEMRSTINEYLEPRDLVGMIACHMVTLPVFEALFGSAEFAQRNPVVKALTEMISALDREGLANEARELDHFYQSVKIRVRDVTDPDGRLRILLELYESFFEKGMPGETSRLGIAYTPLEVVDFILRSADFIARKEFGRGLTAEDVHILDPFSGTGTFINRLLTLPDLIADKDLPRKYSSELHANEILLLAYYIATVKIEQGYQIRRPADPYQPFDGIILTDTFELNPQQPTMPTLGGNSERAKRQAKMPIEVIVGNPPWSAGQKSAGEDNPNLPHPTLEQRIRDTYFKRSRANLKRSLYDSYKMSIRWATDRMGDRGIIAFVTPNGYLDGNAESGMRACFAEEFSNIYVFNLRGNARLSGEARQREKGNVFGSSTRVGVAITVLVKQPQTNNSPPPPILYRDIGDYRTTQEKRQILEDLGSMDGIENWHAITPNHDHDWINQGDPTWNRLMLLGHPGTKDKRAGAPNTLVRVYSAGIKTNRDDYVYSFDQVALSHRMQKMAEFYETRRQAVKGQRVTFEEATRNDSLHVIKWTGDLRARLQRDTLIPFGNHYFRVAHHRPFVKQWVYFDALCINSVYRIPNMFPTGITPNQAMAVSGKGSTKAFSSLVTDTTPDLELVSKAQVFPRHSIEEREREREREREISGRTRRSTSQERERASGSRHSLPTPPPTCISSPEAKPSLGTPTQSGHRDHRTWVERGLLGADHRHNPRHSIHGQRAGVPPIHLRGEDQVTSPNLLDMNDPANTSDTPDEYGRIDNITDWCLTQFRQQYHDQAITKDHIWAYIYGVLHAPDWRSRYANDLRKGLPRIPFAPVFWAFTRAGQHLIDLHLGFETCEPWPLEIVTTGDPNCPDTYRIEGKMRWAKERNQEGKLVPNKATLHINDHCRIEGIPEEAHQYVVNGKTPLDWAIDRLQVTTDTASGIVNDANKWYAWADEPRNLVLHLQRLVRISVETSKIIDELPPALAD